MDMEAIGQGAMASTEDMEIPKQIQQGERDIEETKRDIEETKRDIEETKRKIEETERTLWFDSSEPLRTTLMDKQTRVFFRHSLWFDPSEPLRTTLMHK